MTPGTSLILLNPSELSIINLQLLFSPSHVTRATYSSQSLTCSTYFSSRNNYDRSLYDKSFSVPHKRNENRSSLPLATAFAQNILLPVVNATNTVFKSLRFVLRTTKFWSRTVFVYAAFKLAQIRAHFQYHAFQALRAKHSRTVAAESNTTKPPQENKQDPYSSTDPEYLFWRKHHSWTANEIFQIVVDLRGFFIKAGQFMSTRDDFLPPEYTSILGKLQDQVPPMTSQQARRAIEKQLAIALNKQKVALEDVFESIDIDHPIGAATIAQVHRATMRDIIPKSDTDRYTKKKEKNASPHKNAKTVAVKIQYPNSEEIMNVDLSNIRLLCQFLSRFELNFDLVSPVDELAKRIRTEFNFKIEARTMNMIRAKLVAANMKSVVIPTYYQELSTDKLLVMTFLEATPLTRLGQEMQKRKLSKALKKKVCNTIINHMVDAYGEMLFGDGLAPVPKKTPIGSTGPTEQQMTVDEENEDNGLFQCDPHPGNIMIYPDLTIGILDYGQAKRLDMGERIQMAHMMLAISERNKNKVYDALYGLGFRLSYNTNISAENIEKTKKYSIEERFAYTMFDSAAIKDLSHNPFSKDSVIKMANLEKFPQELFFLFRTIQILRGVIHGMDLKDYSIARRWKSKAQNFLKRHRKYEQQMSVMMRETKLKTAGSK